MEMLTEVKQQENEMNLAFATSDFYQLLSLSLQFPSEELATALNEGGFWEDALSILEDLSCRKENIRQMEESIAHVKTEAITAEDLYQKMRQEYTRLFNDPKNPQLAIYESLFLYKAKENGEKPMLFLSREAVDAEKMYKEAGVKVDKTFREPADHIATELEFMMFLYARKGKALQEQDGKELDKVSKIIETFQRKHLEKWEYAFFEHLETETGLGYYRVIARIAKAGLERLKEVKLSH
jgi:TorA maturation chaperone TorD